MTPVPPPDRGPVGAQAQRNAWRHQKRGVDIRTKIILPLALCFLVLLTVADSTLRHYLHEHVESSVKEQTSTVNQMFREKLDGDADLMRAQLDFLAADQTLRQAWLDRDREKLVRLASPIFQKLRARYRVTHFYFHDPDRVCFLRIHRPELYGDSIDRFTMDQAARSLSTSHGIELGNLGTFTLRVVTPWWIDGELVGFLELGEEIDHITPRLRDILTIDVIFTIDKKYLSRRGWEEGLEAMGKSGDWDRYPDLVVIDSRSTDLPAPVETVLRGLPGGERNQVGIAGEAEPHGWTGFTDHRYHTAKTALIDAGERQVGDMIVVIDTAKEQERIEKMSLILTASGFAVGLGLILLFWKLLSRIQQSLNQAHAELSDFIRKQEHSQKLLERSQSSLQVEVEQRREAEKELELQVAELAESRQITLNMMRRAEQSRFEMTEMNTELKRTAERANRLAEEAQQASKAKSEFLANMSHEIRTPLNGVVGMTGLLIDTELDQEQQQYAEALQSSADFLLSVINDVLDYSKIEAGKLELEAVDFDLRGALDGASDMLALRSHEKGLEYTILVNRDVPKLVRGDPGRIRQILVNLVNNAVKFTSEGEVVIRVALDGEDEKGAKIRIAVTDTGIGIPREKQPALFEAFTQADASTTRKYGGSGLGLTKSKPLPAMMGGAIGVESIEGDGSTFWFTVVLGRQEAAAETLPNLASGDVRILVVAPLASTRCMVLELLESLGCRCTGASETSSALGALRTGAAEKVPYRVVIMDSGIPPSDREALLSGAEGDPGLKESKVILLVKRNELHDPSIRMDRRISAVLSKPVKGGDVLGILQEFLARPEGAIKNVKKHSKLQRNLSEIVGKNLRILLVEDNRVNQKVALRLLEKMGCSADVAANGVEGLRALEASPYDLVLMDCQMPEMDGYEATRTIRDGSSSVLDHDIPIVAMTASAMIGDREECLAAGMNDYIAKPFSPWLLCEVIERCLTPAVDGQEVTGQTSL